MNWDETIAPGIAEILSLTIFDAKKVKMLRYVLIKNNIPLVFVHAKMAVEHSEPLTAVKITYVAFRKTNLNKPKFNFKLN